MHCKPTMGSSNQAPFKMLVIQSWFCLLQIYTLIIKDFNTSSEWLFTIVKFGMHVICAAAIILH